MPSHAECKALAAKLKPPEPKNFITANAVENILAVPKRQPEPVDWLKKPNFGTVPPYLQKIKKEINDEYEYIRSMQQSQTQEGPPGMRLLPEDERMKLIDELKQKWDSVNMLYQQSSVLSLASLDTIGKVKRCAPHRASSRGRAGCGVVVVDSRGAAAQGERARRQEPRGATVGLPHTSSGRQRGRGEWCTSSHGTSGRSLLSSSCARHPHSAAPVACGLQEGDVRGSAGADREGHRKAFQEVRLRPGRGCVILKPACGVCGALG